MLSFREILNGLQGSCFFQVSILINFEIIMNVHGCNVRDIGIHFPEEAEFTREYNPLPFIGENRICYQCKPCPYCSVWFCSIKVTKDGTLNVRNVWSIHDECTYSPLSFYLFIYSENFRDFEFWIFSKSGC